jgi:hypothetical protein
MAPRGNDNTRLLVLQRLAIFIGICAALWLVVAIPARHLIGEWALAYSGTAALVCLVPAALTLAWATWVSRKAPESFLLMMLAGTGVRLFAVAGAALVLDSMVPFYSQHPGFWGWLVFFYLVILAVETGIILSAPRPGHKSDAADAAPPRPAASIQQQ